MLDDRESTRSGDFRGESLTGSGGRRRWSAADKARVVADSLAPGVGASEAARRWHVGRRQVYAWRREAQAGLLPQLSGIHAPEPAFVPIVAEPALPAATLPGQPTAAAVPAIEVEIAGAVVRVLPGMDDGWLAAVLRAVRASAAPA